MTTGSTPKSVQLQIQAQVDISWYTAIKCPVLRGVSLKTINMVVDAACRHFGTAEALERLFEAREYLLSSFPKEVLACASEDGIKTIFRTLNQIKVDSYVECTSPSKLQQVQQFFKKLLK
ncbi:MAG TPA: hypothetical protein VN457_03060 [Chlamydiales bacterium]|nr:hypothetical protein [Chlamydiales bacterium]